MGKVRRILYKSAEAVNGVTRAHASLQQNVCSIDDTGCFGIGLNT